jgi:hypothetical protein
MSTKQPRKSFWTTIPGIITGTTAFLTAIAGLIAALSSVGLIGGKPNPENFGSYQTGGQSPVVTTAAPAARNADVDLVYLGDNYGCNLQIVVNIGGQTAQPTGNRYTISNVPVGDQHYTVRGTITCATVGQCAASGSGNLTVMDGAEYDVVWLNTAVGRCDVTLKT